MATSYVKVMTDDMSENGEAADVTMEYGFAGTDYEIDLSNKRFSKYDAMFQELIAHSRKVAKARGKKTTPTAPMKHGATGMSKEQLTAVRRWARENDYPNLSDKGRIPGEVLAAFEAAGGLSLVPEFQAPEFSNPQ